MNSATLSLRLERDVVSRLGPGPAQLLGFCLLYVAGAWAGHTFVSEPGHIVLFWLPSGLLLGVLLVTPRREWPTYLLLSAGLTYLLNTAWRAHSPLVGIGFGLATTLEALLAAVAMRWRFGPSLRFERVKDVAGLVMISLLVAAPVAALIGASTAWLSLFGPFWRELRCWWLGDVLGIVVATPPVLAFAGMRERRPAPPRFAQVAELVACCGLIAVGVAIVYGSSPQAAVPPSLLFPLLIWAAARFGALGMSLALLIITPVASHLTISGHGPLAHLASAEWRALSLQAVMIVFGVTGWVLATLWQELGQALSDLRVANEHLEETVLSRTASLRASEERFRSVFEHAHTGIAICGLGGGFEQCNPAYGAMLDYSCGELTTTDLGRTLHPEDRNAFLMRLRELVTGRLPFVTEEARQLTREGRAVWVEAFVSLLRSGGDPPTHLLVLATDITARKNVERERHEADRRKDEFIAMLAHELRNPLAPIRTAASVLHTLTPADPRLVRCRDILERQSSLMGRLLDDLLDVSRLSRGHLVLRPAPTSLTAVLAAAIETSRPLLDTQGQQLSVDWPAADIVLTADAARLTQVFSNLLNNAAKYTGAGGHVHLAAHEAQGNVVVTVADDGVGIPQEMIERIFDLFVQSKETRTLTRGGLGIGLSLARRLVGLHGGTIAVASAGPGRGSTFTVHLPVVGPGEPADERDADRVAHTPTLHS